MFPVFSKDANGVVSLTDTQTARIVKAKNRKWAKPVKYREDKVAACRQCREAGGDESDPKQWMGFLRIQWGSFRINPDLTRCPASYKYGRGGIPGFQVLQMQTTKPRLQFDRSIINDGKDLCSFYFSRE